MHAMIIITVLIVKTIIWQTRKRDFSFILGSFCATCHFVQQTFSLVMFIIHYHLMLCAILFISIFLFAQSIIHNPRFRASSSDSPLTEAAPPHEPLEEENTSEITTAVFYSITSTQRGQSANNTFHPFLYPLLTAVR